jgi:hypothetical protein
MRCRRLDLAVDAHSDFLLSGAPSGFFLPGTPLGILLPNTVGSIRPQAATVLTDKLPPDLKPSKSDSEPPLPDYLPAATAPLFEFLLQPPSLYAGFQGKETP